MKSIWFLAVLGCGRDTPAEPVQQGSGSGYTADIDNLCNVMERSGAATKPERTFVSATWLGQHITTQEGRRFLARIQTLTGEPKAAALEAEATRVGLSGCPLAGDWRAAKPK
ncbi:MAG: hypothetical protein ABI867_02500 [Kofleriaceae bacterium]